MAPPADDSMVVLVTGAARGIGRALVEKASGAGHRVVLNYRSAASGADAEACAARLSARGGETLALQADVALAAEVEQLVSKTIERFGRLDAVINNAGVGDRIPLEDLDEVSFNRTLRANLTSAFLVSQAAWPRMTARGGRLIFMSSGAARTGGGLSAAYAASKAGLEGLMHAYATTLRPYGITANAIAPSMFETSMADKIPQPDRAALPMARMGSPDEIWPVVRMLLVSEYITGQTIHIDAGRYMT